MQTAPSPELAINPLPGWPAAVVPTGTRVGQRVTILVPNATTAFNAALGGAPLTYLVRYGTATGNRPNIVPALVPAASGTTHTVTFDLPASVLTSQTVFLTIEVATSVDNSSG